MENRSIIIAPSLLSANFASLGHDVDLMLSYGADWLHVDVMDGHFVNNLTIGAPVVSSLRKYTSGFLDCHLMVSDPAKWVDDFAKAGADMFSFHPEPLKDSKAAHDLITKVRNSGIGKVGIAVKPRTPVEDILEYIPELDYVLIMTVEPGFGGQSFMSDMMPKVKELREKFPNLDIGVDGGLDTTTVHEAAKAGANVIIAGSSIFKASDPKKTIEELRRICGKY